MAFSNNNKLGTKHHCTISLYRFLNIFNAPVFPIIKIYNY